MERIATSVEADSVDALLRDLRVSSTVFCQSALGAPWGFGVRARGLAAFHVVTSGSCWLQVEDDGEPKRLTAGDLVILPRAEMHVLRDAPETPALWLEDLLAKHPVDSELRLRGGGGGATTSLLCGAFAIEGSAQHPVLATLPQVVHLRGAGEAPLPWLAATLELISIEVANAGAGAAAIWERLSELMLKHALRACARSTSTRSGRGRSESCRSWRRCRARRSPHAFAHSPGTPRSATRPGAGLHARRGDCGRATRRSRRSRAKPATSPNSPSAARSSACSPSRRACTASRTTPKRRCASSSRPTGRRRARPGHAQPARPAIIETLQLTSFLVV